MDASVLDRKGIGLLNDEISSDDLERGFFEGGDAIDRRYEGMQMDPTSDVDSISGPVASLRDALVGLGDAVNEHLGVSPHDEVDMGRRNFFGDVLDDVSSRRLFLSASIATFALASAPALALASTPGAHGEIKRALLRFPSRTLELINSFAATGNFGKAIAEFFTNDHFSHKDWTMALTHAGVNLVVSTHSAVENMKHAMVDMGLLVPVLFGTAWGDVLPDIQEKLGVASKFELDDDLNVSGNAKELVLMGCRDAKVGALSSGAFAIKLDAGFGELAYQRFFEPAFIRLEASKQRLIEAASDDHAQEVEARVASILLGKLKLTCQTSFAEAKINDALGDAQDEMENLREYFSGGKEGVNITDEDKQAFAEFEEEFGKFSSSIIFDKDAKPGTLEFETLEQWKSMTTLLQSLRNWANNIGKLAVGDPPNYIMLWQVFRRVFKDFMGDEKLELNGKLLTPLEGMILQFEAITGVVPAMLKDFDVSLGKVAKAFGEEDLDASFIDELKEAGATAWKESVLTFISVVSLIAEPFIRALKLVPTEHLRQVEMFDNALKAMAERILDTSLDTGDVAYAKKMRTHLGEPLKAIGKTMSVFMEEVVPMDVRNRRDYYEAREDFDESGIAGPSSTRKLMQKRDEKFDSSLDETAENYKSTRVEKRRFMRAVTAASPEAMQQLLGKVRCSVNDFQNLYSEMDAASVLYARDAEESDDDHGHDGHHSSDVFRWDRIENVFGDLEAARLFLYKTDMILAIGNVKRPDYESTSNVIERTAMRNQYIFALRDAARGVAKNYASKEFEMLDFAAHVELLTHEILPIIKENIGPGTEEVFALVAIQLVYLQSVMPTIKLGIDAIIGDKAVRNDHGKFEKAEAPIEDGTYQNIVAALIILCGASAFADNMAMYMATSMKLLEELLEAGLITHDMFFLGTRALYNSAIEFGAMTPAGGPASAPFRDGKFNAPQKGGFTIVANVMGNFPQFSGGNLIKRTAIVTALKFSLDALEPIVKAKGPKWYNGFKNVFAEFFAGEDDVEEPIVDEEVSKAKAMAGKLLSMGGTGMSILNEVVQSPGTAVDKFFKQPGNRARREREEAFVYAMKSKLGGLEAA